jgi:hypothetical protein
MDLCLNDTEYVFASPMTIQLVLGPYKKVGVEEERSIAQFGKIILEDLTALGLNFD